jgi:hypothetical protein
MANFFSAPRSRQIVYTPDIKDSEVLTKSGVKNALTQALGTLARVAAANVPVLDRLIFGVPGFIMPGVQRVSWAYVRDITEQYGLQRYSLLPWYTKAVSVTVAGKYYIGAFSMDTITSISNIVRTRNLVTWIRDEMSRIDKLVVNRHGIGKTFKTAKDQGLLSSLAVGPLNDPDSMALFGFIRKFTVAESVESPFIQNYTMEYIGIDRQWYNDQRAAAMNSADKSSR